MMEDPSNRLQRMLAGLGPPPPSMNPSPLFGTPFGMNAYEQAQMQTAREARTTSNLQRQSEFPGTMNGNIGGYQAGPEWDVFFNALKGQKGMTAGQGSLLPNSPAPSPETGHRNGLLSWLSNPLVPKGDGTY